MKVKFAILAAGAGILLFLGIPASAHHSFAGTYLEDAEPITVEGTIKAVLVRNPHSFVTIEDDKLKEKDGQPVSWGIEWGAAGQLAQQGVKQSTLRVGDHVIVTGSLGRNAEDHRLRMRTLIRPKQGDASEFRYGFGGQTFN
jgi:hypothetical protein